MIRITLKGDPGHRTGTVTIDSQTWQLVTWFRQADGHIQSTTDDAKRVTLALDAGRGGITIDRTHWFISGAAWAGLVMTGTATPGVSDAEMATMLPGCGWEARDELA